MRKIIFVLFGLFPSLLLADIKHPPLQVNDNGNIYYGWFYLLTITGGTTTNNNDGTLTTVCGAITDQFLLLEDASFLLLEDGTKLVLQ